jgi:hypothetical protein
MHRAGTSAVARGLAAVGLDLGPRLMSADVRMNARGFFEDVDLVALDDALLAAEGADWKSVDLLAHVDWRAERHAQARAEARRLLAARVAPTGAFACKDPRMPRLLPFWQVVLADLAYEDAYVIAIRHPHAVAASLTARDALDPRRSEWLWLSHLLCSLAYTQGRPRVVVDYDRLLEAPERELARIASALSLPAAGAGALRAFRDDFLAPDMRHARFAATDIEGLPPLVADAHRLAARLADDTLATNAAEGEIAALFVRLREHAPLLAYAGAVERVADDAPRLAGELAWARESLAAAEAYAADMRAALAQKDASLADAKAYHDDLHANLERLERELATAQRALDRLATTLPGRALLRWLRRAPRN